MNKNNNNYEILKIKKIVSETNTIKTFIFDWEMEPPRIPKPGQFVMVWSFKEESDEKPMSVSIVDIENKKIGITVKNVGKFTKSLHDLKVGDKLGIRGPYGNSFNLENLKNKNILAIGGGVGMAPIHCFVSYAKEKNANIDLISASITKNELLFAEKTKIDKVKNSKSESDKAKNNKIKYNKAEIGNVNIFTCTDDGTCGFKGFATHRTIDLLKSKSYDMAVVCGPELMMKGIFDLLENHNIPSQYSLERYMKCAMGICGQCCVDRKGWRICVEGPIFSNIDLKQIDEFGKYCREASGIKNSF